MYEGIVFEAVIDVYSICVSGKQRGETMRENRGYYSGFAVSCVSSFFWIIERKDWLFGVDVAQIG